MFSPSEGCERLACHGGVLLGYHAPPPMAGSFAHALCPSCLIV